LKKLALNLLHGRKCMQDSPSAITYTPRWAVLVYFSTVQAQSTRAPGTLALQFTTPNLDKIQNKQY